MNEQTGIVMPLMYDEGKNKMFDFELLSVDNTTAQYIAQAITRYDNKILTALFSDVMRLGQDGVGSYSLADSKTNLLAMGIEARLKEIQDTLNNDLIPWLYKMNGWRDEEMPKFVYGDLDEIDLEAFSKAIQRIKAVGLITPTAKNVNYIAEVLGLPDEVEDDIDQEELNVLLGKPTSRSGDGMDKGAGNGTSDSVAEDDNSSLNAENKG
jgi:phage gp29-like protein